MEHKQVIMHETVRLTLRLAPITQSVGDMVVLKV